MFTLKQTALKTVLSDASGIVFAYIAWKLVKSVMWNVGVSDGSHFVLPVTGNALLPTS
jgi:hypothetical protein